MNKKNCITFIFTLAIIGSGFYLWNNLNIVSNLVGFMSFDSLDRKSQVILNYAEKSANTNVVFVKLNGSNKQQLASLSDELKSSLTSKTSYFRSINNAHQSVDTKTHQDLFKYRYLLNASSSFDENNIHKQLEKLLHAFKQGASDKLIQYLLLDPLSTFINYLSSNQSEIKLKSHHGVWFMADAALLVVQLNSASIMGEQQQAIQFIIKTFNQLNTTQQINLELLGASVIADNSKRSIEQTMQYLSWALLIISLVIFGWGYRSLPLFLLAGISLVTSLLFAMLITQMVFDQVHAIVLVFGISSLGLCLDYSLHLFSHINKNEKPSQTILTIWKPLRLSALTSVFAYLVLMSMGFKGLIQMSFFTIIGLITSLYISRYCLPIWLTNFKINQRFFVQPKPLFFKQKLTITILVIGLPLGLLLNSEDIFSTSINQLNPASNATRQSDNQTRQALKIADINHIFLVEKETLEETLKQTEEITNHLEQAVQNNIITTLFSPSKLLPSQARQKHHQSLLPSKEILLQRVNSATKHLGFKKSVFNHFIDDVNANKTTNEYVTYQVITNTSIGDRLQSILFKHNGFWYSFIQVAGIKDSAKFNQLIQSTTIKPYYYNVNAISDSILARYLEKTWHGLLWLLAFFVIVNSFLTLKNSQRIWLMVPVISGVLFSLSLQVLQGNDINIFHLLSLLLVIGMGFDYSLFFNQSWSNQQLRYSTHAITLSLITTVVTFSILALSDIGILNSMGQTVVSGIISCFVVARWISVPCGNNQSK